MDASEKSLTWKEQKDLISFFVDGTGKVEPTSDFEKNFTDDLYRLILHFCKDEENFEMDLRKSTEARGYDLVDHGITADDVRRVRQRYFGSLVSELAERSDD